MDLIIYINEECEEEKALFDKSEEQTHWWFAWTLSINRVLWLKS